MSPLRRLPAATRRVATGRRSLAAGAAVVLVALGAGCGGRGGGASRGAGEGVATAATHHSAPDLRVDISTPDRALRSRWRLQDLSRDVSVAMDSTVPGARGWNAWHRAQRALLTGDAEAAARRDDIRAEPAYRREILEVRQESASRAVILARVANVSPIPAGAVVSEYEAELRRDGELYR